MFFLNMTKRKIRILEHWLKMHGIKLFLSDWVSAPNPARGWRACSCSPMLVTADTHPHPSTLSSAPVD